MEKLINKQKRLKADIERIIANFKKDSNKRKTKVYFKNKAEELAEKWYAFEENHSKIEEADEDEGAEKYFSENVYATVSELRQDHKITLEEGLAEISSQDNAAVKNDEINLPQMNLPRFGGEYKEWMSFKDIFTTLIHNNKRLANVQKLHYLKANLYGEAEGLLKQFTITDANYTVAWQMLQDRYSNNRILIKAQLKTLLSQPILTYDSAANVRKLLDTTTECLQALQNLKVNVNNWDELLVYIVSERLPIESKRLWEQEIGAEKEYPKYEKLKIFVESRFRVLESLGTEFKSNHQQRKVFANTYQNICKMCNEAHQTFKCPEFTKLSIKERKNWIMRKGLCMNCLGNGHVAHKCTYKTSCFKCNERHHTMIHEESSTGQDVGEASRNNVNRINREREMPGPSTQNFHTQKAADEEVLLATALVKIKADKGFISTIRVLIDPASQASFISETIVQLIKAKCKSTTMKITSLQDVQTGIANKRTCVTVQSRYSDKTVQVDAYVLKKLTDILPNKRIKGFRMWTHLHGLELADPEFTTPSKIDMILGADQAASFLLEGLKIRGNEEPIAQNTIFGWVIFGQTGVHNNNTRTSSSCFTIFNGSKENEEQNQIDSNIQLSKLVEKFWEIEEIFDNTRLTTAEDKTCEKFYNQTTTRMNDGKYMVRLPFKTVNSTSQLGRSRGKAISRLKGLERKFEKAKQFEIDYTKVIQEYQHLDHMKRVKLIENSTNEEIYSKNGRSYYLPHHAVVKDSSTTKLRVVFDASAKTVGGPSLNELLLTGPKLQDNLAWILLRWRLHKIVLSADIEKMYRQIWMHPDDAEYQRIVWREKANENIEDFKLVTVTFGTSSAPYLAVRTLLKLAEDEGNKFPLAAEKLRSDFYVDDCLTGAETTKEAIKLQKDLTELLKCGGFNLRKWTSNSTEVLAVIPEEDKEVTGVIKLDLDENIKTLGLYWYPFLDQFKYKVINKLQKRDKLTKRQFLSDISKIYDPLGFLVPFIIQLKIMMQLLWLDHINWENEVPETIKLKWDAILQEINVIEDLKIPRWIGTATNYLEIHGFSDASIHAYAAVLYTKTIDANGVVKVCLLTAKSKVAPIKQKSIPRLELCAALLLVRLFESVKEALKVPKVTITAWSDSKIVLAWLKGYPAQRTTFVGNRIAEIQEKCRNWRYVPSEQNPADCASRGLGPVELQSHVMWWNGPSWLRSSEEEWPETTEIEDTSLESRKIKIFKVSTADNDTFQILLKRFSSLTKLLRVTATVVRFTQFCRRKELSAKGTPLKATEIQEATNFWIKRIQKQEFEVEKDENGQITCERFKSLTPFLDGNGILRVTGRLDNADASWEEKHPIILPQSHIFTKLLVHKTHLNTLHGGSLLMRSVLRRNYWITQMKRVIKEQIHKCIICYRYRTEQSTQLMGSLPSPRVRMSRPFQHTGVDYCGPVEIKISKLRNARTMKCYISLFICLVTKAIHIEVVTELTSEAFLAAFKRFVSRRGLVTDMYSDNGTNFVGAKNQLDTQFEKYINMLRSKLPEILVNYDMINWHYIPVLAPNYGGLWEAAVKSFKYHLKRIMGNAKLTYEEMVTVTTQIEACLNSRPLYAMNEDPDDLTVLTPGHFLTGSPLLAVPEPSYLNLKEHRLNRWQHLQQLVQSFWKSWHVEYLHTLQHRPKWQRPENNVKENQLVLIKEDNLPPNRWALGRVIKTIEGDDKLVRLVHLKVKDAIIERVISKICVLPLD